MRTPAHQTRDHRTITVDVQNAATSFPRLGHGPAFLACVRAFVVSLGFQLAPKATWRGGGGLTRPSHDARVRRGGLTLWRLPCMTCRAVFTVRPHFVLR